MLATLLNTYSYFSFGRGVSSPSRLVQQAVANGYTSVALTDHLGVYGAAELHEAARDYGIKAVFGATLDVDLGGCTYPLVLYASSRESYQRLCTLITYAHEDTRKRLSLAVLKAHAQNL